MVLAGAGPWLLTGMKQTGGLHEGSGIWAQPKKMKGIWADGVGEGNSGGLEQLEQGPGGRQVCGALGKSHWFWLEHRTSREAAVDEGVGWGEWGEWFQALKL